MRRCINYTISFDSNYKGVPILRQKAFKGLLSPFSSELKWPAYGSSCLSTSPTYPPPPRSHTPASVTLAAQVLPFIITTNLPFFCRKFLFPLFLLGSFSSYNNLSFKEKETQGLFVLFITKNHPITTGLLC